MSALQSRSWVCIPWDGEPGLLNFHSINSLYGMSFQGSWFSVLPSVPWVVPLPWHTVGPWLHPGVAQSPSCCIIKETCCLLHSAEGASTSQIHVSLGDIDTSSRDRTSIYCFFNKLFLSTLPPRGNPPPKHMPWMRWGNKEVHRNKQSCPARNPFVPRPNISSREPSSFSLHVEPTTLASMLLRLLGSLCPPSYCILQISYFAFLLHPTLSSLGAGNFIHLRIQNGLHKTWPRIGSPKMSVQWNKLGVSLMSLAWLLVTIKLLRKQAWSIIPSCWASYLFTTVLAWSTMLNHQYRLS